MCTRLPFILLQSVCCHDIFYFIIHLTKCYYLLKQRTLFVWLRHIAQRQEGSKNVIVWVLCLESRTRSTEQRKVKFVCHHSFFLFPQPTSFSLSFTSSFFHSFFSERNLTNARFQSQIKSRSGVRCQICDGSSDVFTLFVVFLFMNSLEQTTNALTFLSYPQIRTSEHVNSNQAESTCLCLCVCV